MELHSDLLKRLSQVVDLKALELHSPRKHQSKRKAKAKAKTVSNLSPHAEANSKRIPSVSCIPVCYPSNRAFNIRNSTTDLGPGQYKSPFWLDDVTPSYLFETSPRFKSTLRERTEHYSGYIRHNQQKTTALTDMNTYKPEVRKFIIEESAKLRVTRELSVKQARKHLDDQIQQARNHNFMKKVKKIELVSRGGVRNKQEVLAMKHYWFTTMALYGWIRSLKIAYIQKSRLRVRSEYLLGLLYYYSKAIGKVKAKLKAIRVARSIKTFRKNSFIMKNWLLKRKALHNQIFSTFLDRALVAPILLKLFDKWRKSLIE